jgi:ADP-ribose pyrophosphatase
MKKTIQLSSGIKLINKKYKSNQVYHYLSEVDNVLVVAKIKNLFVVVRQKRIPISCSNFEFPVGRIDSKEKPREAALREFLEETGYKINGNLKKLFTCFIDPGRNTKKIHCFYTSNIVLASKPEKGISLFFLSQKKIEILIKKNFFNNAFNIAAFYFVIKNRYN